MYKKKMMDSRWCSGCRNDFYNGNNELGITKCWGLEGAKVIKRKKVHISQVPPWKQKARLFPSCYHQAQYVFVGENQED